MYSHRIIPLDTLFYRYTRILRKDTPDTKQELRLLWKSVGVSSPFNPFRSLESLGDWPGCLSTPEDCWEVYHLIGNGSRK
ncbi:hypothetical protein CEXT_281671 [Caerostris extrusa]|uniref:Uncharacterized protein n=1 Tax=Caerostris extrusa TaxID=172846 RepID=A0AAV4XS62_CAEEX|nr:hypothetical protein CEXT_281671 [Caerostris extrusa]